MPSDVVSIGEKKFMWDGVDFPSKEAVLDAMQAYKKNGFEVELLEEGDKLLLYTRRVVKEVVVQGP
jgi:hypothetical protein